MIWPESRDLLWPGWLSCGLPTSSINPSFGLHLQNIPECELSPPPPPSPAKSPLPGKWPLAWSPDFPEPLLFPMLQPRRACYTRNPSLLHQKSGQAEPVADAVVAPVSLPGDARSFYLCRFCPYEAFQEGPPLCLSDPPLSCPPSCLALPLHSPRTPGALPAVDPAHTAHPPQPPHRTLC